MAKYALGNGRKTFKECENHNSYRYGISIESLWVYPLDSALIERGISLFVGGSFWSLKIAGDFDKNVEIHYKFWKIISDLLATQQNRAVSIIEIRVADTRRTIIRLVRVFVTSATPTPPHCWTESVVSVRQVSCQIWSTNFSNLERGDHPALSHSQPKDFLSIYQWEWLWRWWTLQIAASLRFRWLQNSYRSAAHVRLFSDRHFLIDPQK